MTFYRFQKIHFFLPKSIFQNKTLLFFKQRFEESAKIKGKREKQQQSLSPLVWSHDLFFFYLDMFNNTISFCKFGKKSN